MPQRITGHTRLIGLIADPIKHSKSPMMHNTAFEALGLDYVYLAFEVGESGLTDAVNGLKALDAKGFNVSLPYKAEIMKYLDEILPAGRLCNAVNTVINRDGVWVGTNTDGLGFMTSLREQGVETAGKKITLLGAGGAATAVAMQAGLDGVGELSIFNRDDEFMGRAMENAERLNEETACRAAAFPLEDTRRLREEIASSDILVNATSAGFGPQKDLCPIPDASYLRKDLFVADVIYSPEQTVLLKMAEECGCSFMNGIGMMIYQGAAAFELWTGEPMPVDEVRRVL